MDEKCPQDVSNQYTSIVNQDFKAIKLGMGSGFEVLGGRTAIVVSFYYDRTIG